MYDEFALTNCEESGQEFYREFIVTGSSLALREALLCSSELLLTPKISIWIQLGPLVYETYGGNQGY